MEVYNANYWEFYEDYILKKKRGKFLDKKHKVSKKEHKAKISKNNTTKMIVAKKFAYAMKSLPSVLEKRMQEFLNHLNINYEFQKIFRIKDKGIIRKFYIADFYIPAKNLIIETDGAFHDKQIREDLIRTEKIKAHYPNIKVIRWRWHDFDSSEKIKNLISYLQ